MHACPDTACTPAPAAWLTPPPCSWSAGTSSLVYTMSHSSTSRLVSAGCPDCTTVRDAPCFQRQPPLPSADLALALMLTLILTLALALTLTLTQAHGTRSSRLRLYLTRPSASCLRRRATATRYAIKRQMPRTPSAAYVKGWSRHFHPPPLISIVSSLTPGTPSACTTQTRLQAGTP